jgi:hypothetical protein
MVMCSKGQLLAGRVIDRSRKKRPQLYTGSGLKEDELRPFVQNYNETRRVGNFGGLYAGVRRGVAHAKGSKKYAKDEKEKKPNIHDNLVVNRAAEIGAVEGPVSPCSV